MRHFLMGLLLVQSVGLSLWVPQGWAQSRAGSGSASGSFRTPTATPPPRTTPTPPASIPSGSTPPRSFPGSSGIPTNDGDTGSGFRITFPGGSIDLGGGNHNRHGNQNQHEVAQEDVESGQVLMLWKKPQASQPILAALAAEQIRPVASTRLKTLGWLLVLFQFPDHAAASQHLADWQKRFPEIIADYNFLYRAQSEIQSEAQSEAQSEHQGREYALSMLDLPAAKSIDKPLRQRLSQTRVGILDTDVVPTLWLRDVTLTREHFTAANPAGPIDLPAHPAHGTAIASLIARVAPTTQLYAAAVMTARDDQTLTTTHRLVQGVDWLLGKRVQVINMSLAGRRDKLFAATVAELMQRKVLVTAAAGNQGRRAPPAYPAAYATTHAGVLAVTACDVDGQLYRQANRGTYITVAAPGVDLWVPAALDTSAPDSVAARYVSGTSYASAYVAGAAAYWLAWLAKNRNDTGKNVSATFCKTAKDLGATGRDEEFGCGLLQIKAALKP